MGPWQQLSLYRRVPRRNNRQQMRTRRWLTIERRLQAVDCRWVGIHQRQVANSRWLIVVQKVPYGHLQSGTTKYTCVLHVWQGKWPRRHDNYSPPVRGVYATYFNRFMTKKSSPEIRPIYSLGSLALGYAGANGHGTHPKNACLVGSAPCCGGCPPIGLGVKGAASKIAGGGEPPTIKKTKWRVAGAAQFDPADIDRRITGHEEDVCGIRHVVAQSCQSKDDSHRLLQMVLKGQGWTDNDVKVVLPPCPPPMPPRQYAHFGTPPLAGIVTSGAGPWHVASLRSGGQGVKQRILSYHMTPVTQVIGHRQQHCSAALQHCLFTDIALFAGHLTLSGGQGGGPVRHKTSPRARLHL